MPFSTCRNRVSTGVALWAALGFAGLAGAQADRAAAPASTSYQQEREACLSGKSGQDQATCLREVGAARDAARKGHLDSGQGELERNRTDRCKPLTGADQADCYARMRGEGRVEGSVKGGGVIREKRTVIRGDAAASSPSSRPAGSTGVSAGNTGSGASGATPPAGSVSTTPSSGTR